MLNIFRKAGILCLGFSLLWTLSSCFAVKDAHLKDSSVSAGSEQPPAWVTQRTHPIYPSAFYLIGVGFSDKGSNEADDAARLDLLKQIEVEIKGEESAVQTESSQSGSNKSSATKSSTYVQTRVESTVHMTVPGLRIEERWMDSTHTRYYSLAVLDREDASERLYRQITDMQKKINVLVNAGEEAEGRRDYSGAVSRYQEALNYIGSVQSLISPYNVIRGRDNFIPLEKGGEGGFDLESSVEKNGKTETDLKIRIERISGKFTGSPALVTWEDGIRDLILQMASRLPAEGLLTVLQALPLLIQSFQAPQRQP